MISQSTADELNVLFAAELSNAASNKKPAKWPCLLPQRIIGEYRITPLTSGRMLKSEGYLMNNCCRDYIRQCENLEYCIFSVRSLTGKRVATLGIAIAQGHWVFDQCYGPSNTDVLEETYEYLDEDELIQVDWRQTELYYAVHEVVRLMNFKGNISRSEHGN